MTLNDPARLAAALVAACALVQSPNAQQPTFRATSHYVTVDVVITDRSGTPILDISPSELEVLDDGRRQTIADLRLVRSPLLTTGALRPVTDQPDVARNTAAPDGRLFALIVDDHHLLPADLIQTKRALSTVLSHLGPLDQASLTFVGRSDLGVAPTGNFERVATGIDRLSAALGFGVGPVSQQVEIGDAVGGTQTIVLDSRTRSRFALALIDTLRSVGRALMSSTHARKVAILVTNGVVLSQEALGSSYFEVVNRLERVYDDFLNANVPVFTLDPRGAVVPETATLSPSEVNTPQRAAQIRRNVLSQIDMVSEVAANTGGRAIVRRSDVAEAARQIVEENSTFYVVGFYSDPLRADGKTHRLEVKVSRPGVQVRARRRYVAPPRNAGAESSRARLDEALESGLPIGGLELEGTAVPVTRSSGGKLKVFVTLTTKPASADDTPGDALDYGIAAIDNDGRVLALTRGSRSIARPESLPSGPMTAPVSIHDVIDVPRRELSLRGAVWSRALGRVGSVHINFSVPDLDPTQSDGTVAGVIFGRRSPAVASGAMGGLPFEPITLRSFRQSDEIEIAAPIFLARPDSEITVTLAVRAGGQEVARSRLMATEQAPITSQDRLFIGSLPLAALTPGDYTVSIVATDSQSRTSQRTAMFSVR